jgi:hypothetical protein
MTLLDKLIKYRNELVITRKSLGRYVIEYELGEADTLKKITEDLSVIIKEEQANDAAR